MALSDEPRFVDGVWGPHFAALTPDQWLIDGGQSAFGAAIDHLLAAASGFRRRLARARGRMRWRRSRRTSSRAQAVLSHAALIAEGLHVLPDFIGNRSPLADPAARGAVVGHGPARRRSEPAGAPCRRPLRPRLWRSRHRPQARAGGYDFETIVVSGGAARSALVRQIIADACGKTVEAPETPEPVLLGSAMIGAVAAGTQTLVSAMSSMSSDRAEMRAGGRRGRGVPCAKAPRLRDPAAGRARDSRRRR